MEIRINKQLRGVRIITPEDSRKRRELLNGIIHLAESSNFDEIVLPSIEPSSIYVEKAGVEITRQMYTFKDKKGRDICLRPEVTATIQLIAQEYWKTDKDVKLWYFEKCWRYERPQAGRYREFFQFGVEWLNPRNHAEARAELIELAKEIVALQTAEFLVHESVKRGLDYYIEDGFEITVSSLGAQKQVVGGGTYLEGIGFAVGFDRLMLVE